MEAQPRFPWSFRPVSSPLTAGPLDLWAPGSSPDGRRLFALGSSPRRELLRYDARAQALRAFPGRPLRDLRRPEPRRAWLAWTGLPDGALWKRPPRRDGTPELLPPGWRAVLAHWSPDGRSLSFVASPPEKAGPPSTLPDLGRRRRPRVARAGPRGAGSVGQLLASRRTHDRLLESPAASSGT